MKNAVKSRTENKKNLIQDVCYLTNKGSIKKIDGRKFMKEIIQEHFLELKNMSF